MNTKTILEIVAAFAILAVIVFAAFAVQPQLPFTGTRNSKVLTADFTGTTTSELGNITYYEVNYHLEYQGKQPLTNTYFYFSDKTMFEPVIENGWTLNYKTYDYHPSIADSSSVKIIWTGGEQTLIVTDPKP